MVQQSKRSEAENFLSEWRQTSAHALGSKVDANGALTHLTFIIDEPGGRQRKMTVDGSPLAVRFE